MDNKKLYNQISKTINDNEKFLITTHDYPDGDSLGSLIALYQLLSQLKKEVMAVCRGELPYQYSFLPDIDKIRKDMGGIDLSGRDHVCFCLDCADENRMNLDFKVLKDSVRCIINIDHHKNNTNFGYINLVDNQKSATSEILYELIDKHYRNLLNRKIALGLYVGILTDTGKFQYSNTNHIVHRVVSDLLSFNLSPSEVYKHIYENEPLARFKLIQLVFGRIVYIQSCGLIYSYIMERDFKRLKLPFSAQDEIITLLRSAKKAKVTALIKQTGRKCFKVSLRTSNNNIDLSRIANGFGGGGHKMASAYSDNGSLKTVIGNLKKSVGENI